MHIDKTVCNDIVALNIFIGFHGCMVVVAESCCPVNVFVKFFSQEFVLC